MPFRMPFLLRRPWLLVRDLVVDREEPDLDGLARVTDPESFVWRILPHAARTFSASIALLPTPIARATAVAYLYCRTLDTYEDMIEDRVERERALRDFVDRFGGDRGSDLQPASPIDPALATDARDATHVVLVNHCDRVDGMFRGLEAPVRQIIIDLVRGMGEGMIWSSGVFVEQSGTLDDGDQLRRYCRNVLGLPILFAVRMLSWHHTGNADIVGDEREDAMLAGEFIQLANVTRDIEKDLRRAVAYHPSLAADLGRTDLDDPALAERVRLVRSQLLDRALRLGGAYARMMQSLPVPRISLGRASGVLMLLFTERYYRSCARRVGREPWDGPRNGLRLVARSLPAVLSRRATDRILGEVVRDFDRFLEIEQVRQTAVS